MRFLLLMGIFQKNRSEFEFFDELFPCLAFYVCEDKLGTEQFLVEPLG